MKVFIANFTDDATVEAEIDDRADVDMESMASPQFYSISLVRSDAWVDSLKEDWANERQDAYDDPKPHNVEWTEVHDVPAWGRENWKYTAIQDGDIVGMIVIQTVTITQDDETEE